MTAGTKVRYDRAHWEWMQQAGRAQAFHDRRSFTGRVLEDAGETCVVAWDTQDGRPWPFLSTRELPRKWEPTTHLTENLEAIDG